MGIAIRFYLFSDDGLQRISHRLMDGLARGKDAMPQCAGTKQKIANVIVEMEKGKPVRLARADGSFLTFDEAGQVHKDLIASGMAAMETYRALERADQTPAGTVIDLSPKLNREKWERENRWMPSKEDLDAICDDIWKRKKAPAPKVVQAKGIAPKPVTLSYEAKEAIREIQKQVWGISGKLEWLTEATLKGVAFEARELAKADGDNAIWRGVADVADRRREILSLYRTGKGVWHAVVDISRWDVTRRYSESTNNFHERHNSKKEAEEAARRMLADKAQFFSAEYSVEASVVCDLEWHDPD
jgi:hypothetical protein